MFTKTHITLIVLSILLSVCEHASARYMSLERDGRYVALYPRRFNQERPPVIDKIAQACSGEVCGDLSGQAITPLLAASGECTQQDMADSIIDAAQQFDDATKANMIALAIEYRQAEKNTPPDFTTNPPTNRNSVFCQKAPRHAELNGLVQAQDPANDPTIFFDPATRASVKKGAQPNTFAFGTAGSASSNSSSVPASALVAPASAAPAASMHGRDLSDVSDDCVVTVTVTADATATAAATSAVTAVPGTTTASAAASTNAADSSAIGNFGICSVPQIEFGTGFDNRKETSFQPVDKQSYDHGSAQNIDIITQFMCDQLTNICQADQTAKDTCAKAKAAADTQIAKTGAQADAFNVVFGIKTNFASVAVVDDQGRVVSGGSTTAVSQTAATLSATSAAATFSATSAAVAATSTAAATTSSSGIGNFGICSVPQIEFGVGFDNRKETSFQPVDKQSYNHGSAQNIDIITQFMCDQLTNICKADQTAKDTCTKAKAAADTQAAKTGAQADAFNAVFGIKTNFASVAVIDDQGRVVSGGSSPATASATQVAATLIATSGGPAATSAATAATSSSSSGIGNFGKCSVPQIEFGTGFDGRKETSFQPVDKVSYNHGSAQNGDIITQFMCDTLVNTCGADQTARNTCATAKVAFDSKPAKTGAQADAFNAVFGIKTNFATVPAVDNQGNIIPGSTSGSGVVASSAAPAAVTSTAQAATATAKATAVTSSAAASTQTSGATTSGTNLQTFTGTLGGVAPPPVTAAGNNQFQVQGNALFNNLSNALTRSCDVQHNKCADAANASGNKGDLTVAACGDQQTQCNAAQQ